MIKFSTWLMEWIILFTKNNGEECFFYKKGKLNSVLNTEFHLITFIESPLCSGCQGCRDK